MTVRIATRALAIEAWPENDRKCWLAGIGAMHDLFASRPNPRWRDSTVRSVKGSYGRWLTWLKDEHPDVFFLTARERLSRETVELYFQKLKGQLTIGSIATALIHIHAVTRFAAPDLRVAWLRAIVSRCRRESIPIRRKKDRLIPSDDLLKFGLELMREACVAARALDHAQLLQYRDGLAIALLAVRPLRLGNFLDVRIGVHLVDRHGVLWLCFQKGETKNRMDLEFPFPAELVEDLHFYLRVVRLSIAGHSWRSGGVKSDHLWLSQQGKPLGRQTLYAMLKRRTLEHFGKAVGPNLFRDCLATTMASDDFQQAWTVPHVLGHRTVATSERSYIHTECAPEHAAFQRHLAALRARSRNRKK